MGRLGSDMGGLLLLGPAEARVAAAVAFGAAGVLLGPGLRAGAEVGLDGKARFSGVFASATD